MHLFRTRWTGASSAYLWQNAFVRAGIARFFLLCFCFLLASTWPVFAELNKYYVPVLPGTESMDLGLALTNLGSNEVAVSLVARDYKGSVIVGPGITNPATIRIPPSAQRALRTTEIFGSGMAGKAGWAEVTADNDIKGFFLVFDSNVSFIDGADLQSAGSRRLIFQRVTANSTTSSMITFVNITGQPLTGVTLSVYGGALLAPSAQKVFDIPAYSGFSGPITDLIPMTTVIDGYAVIELPDAAPADALVGVGTYKGGADIAVLNPATDASRQRGGYLPHLVTGVGYTTRFSLINYSSVYQTVRVTAQGLDQPGHGIPLGTSSIEKRIAPYTIFAGDVASVFGMVAPTLTTGYLRWEVPLGTPGLIGYLDYGTTDGVLLSAVPAPTSTGTDLVFSHVAQGSGYYTGLALLNLNAVDAGVTITAFDRDGNSKGTASFQLQAGERRSRLISEILPTVSDQLSGYIRLTSTQPLIAFQLFGSSDALRFLADVPAQNAGRPSVVPQPAISNPPAALLQVGPINRVGLVMFTVRVVDANATGVPGINVTCMQIGTPSNGSLAISNFNGEALCAFPFPNPPLPAIFQAFAAGVAEKLSVTAHQLPTISSITPNVITIGNPEVDITISGTDLDQALAVSAGNRRYPVISSSPTEIKIRAIADSSDPIGAFNAVLETTEGSVTSNFVLNIMTPSGLDIITKSVFVRSGSQTNTDFSVSVANLIRDLRSEKDAALTFTNLVAQEHTLTATIAVSDGAPPGFRSVIAETDDGTYLTPIQVLVRPAAAPDIAITAFIPTTARSGMTTTIRFNYLGNDKPTGLYFLRNGVYDPTVLVSGLQPTFFPTVFDTNVTIANDAPPGERTLVAVTARGPVVMNNTLTVIGP